MQQSQQDALLKLIASSSILNSQERVEWLGMVPVMNDKQASELQAILQSTTTEHQAELPPPRLSHISNLPADLPLSSLQGDRTPPAAIQSPVQPREAAPAAFARRLQQQIEEKELVAPPVLEDLPMPPAPKLKPELPPRMHAASMSDVEIIAPPPAESLLSHVKRLKHTSYNNSGKPQLESLTDVSKLAVSALRAMHASELEIKLQQLVKLEGYFNLLSYLEESPLYQDYVTTGHALLANSAEDQSPLTKEEFETFADIMRKIQIS